jgi:hypothetical protein
MSKDYDIERISRIADTDPHVDREKFDDFLSRAYKAPQRSAPSSERQEEALEFDSKMFDIRDATVRPGMGAAGLGREDLSNRPTEDGEFEIFRDDTISLETYKKMSVDPEIAFGTSLLKGWVGGLPYTVECADPMIKGVVDHILEGLWKDLVRNLMDALKIGFAFGEKVWERQQVTIPGEDENGDDMVLYTGKIASLDRIKFLDPQHGFQFFKDKTDRIVRVQQRQGSSDVSVDREKLVWFALDQEYSSVFGKARYKNVYEEWYYSKVNAKYMLSDLQKRGSPHLELRFPRGKSRLDGELVPNSVIAKNIAKKMMSDGLAVLPSETYDNGEHKWTIAYANTKQGASKSPFLEYLKYSDQKKMKGLGIPPSVAGADSNFSSADAGGDMLVVVVEDIVNQLEDIIQKDVVEDIVEYNFGPEMKTLVNLKIDKSALGRRQLMKEILKVMIRTGTSMRGHTTKSWPDPSSMMNELGITSAPFADVFTEMAGADREDGESQVDEAERDEDSNTDARRSEPDDRDRERDASDDDATETS